MPDLSFQVESVEAVPFAAVPLLSFRLSVTNAVENQPIHTVALRCQIQIDVTRRRYSSGEQENLLDLFGVPPRWGQTLRNLLWTHAGTVVQPFTGSTIVDLQVPCTFDFNVAATKYFGGLEAGDIPLSFLFSGTVFYQGADQPLQVAPISWEKEAKFRLPAKLWHDMMELYYPNTAWLCLRRDVFERLHRYKVQNSMLTWEEALESVIPVNDEVTCL